MWKRLAAIAFCAIAGLAFGRTTQWEFIELAPGDFSIAWSVNNAGEVAGSFTMGGHGRAFLWSDGAFTDLGVTGQSSEIRSINHHGVAAGVRGSATGGDVTLWKDGVARSLGISGFPFDINKRGQVVGFERHPDFSASPFLWSDGVLHGLPALLPGRHASAVAINDHGVIAGFSSGADLNSRAVIWENGVIRNLGTLGGFFSSAVDINNHGVVVGSSGTPDFRMEVFVWEGGVMRSLFTTVANQFAHPSAINDRGDIVGQISGVGAGGFLFSDGQLTMLMDLLPAAQRGLWRSVIPRAINDRGWIAGFAVRATNGSLRAFLLRPARGR